MTIDINKSKATCPKCHGSGKCPTCDGNNPNCIWCKNINGICLWCRGTGKKQD